jgi:SAM-dependent methyltransferase
VLVTSRSFEEYLAMFAIDEAELPGRRVLDCCAGASSFVAAASARGAQAVGVDPVYAAGGAELAERAADSHVAAGAIADQHPDRFVWDWYGSRKAREEMRKRALSMFLVDFTANRDRYRAATLPRLPFDDDEFDLAVCSHLLFTWGDQLGLDFHVAAIEEMARVAREVRIFPTVLQGRGEAVPFWHDLLAQLQRDGIVPDVRRVDYEFQRGADQMLVARRLLAADRVQDVEP